VTEFLFNRIRKPFVWDDNVAPIYREEWLEHVRSAVKAGLIELVLPNVERPMTGQLTSEMMLCDHEWETGEDACIHCGASYFMLFGGGDG
jgi:hypothetical protein